MADTDKKTEKVEREYVIPLRKSSIKVPKYKRTGRAIKTIKQFIAKHMKIPQRDLNKVKLDKDLNNSIWQRGRKKPPAKIKVKAIREEDNVKVDFVEIPENIRFKRVRHEKYHKPAEKKETLKEKLTSTAKPEEKSEKEETKDKKEEIEKEKSTEQQNIKQAEISEKAQKHTIKAKEPSIQRKALKK